MLVPIDFFTLELILFLILTNFIIRNNLITKIGANSYLTTFKNLYILGSLASLPKFLSSDAPCRIRLTGITDNKSMMKNDFM